MLTAERLEIEWLNHIQSKFPRRVNTPKSEVVYDTERYLYLIWRHLGLSPIWTGVYAHEDVREGMFDKFFFDLDHETDLELVHMDTLTLFNHFKQKFYREPRLYFSGRKGFHVYLDFYPFTSGFDNFRDTLKAFATDVVEETGITTLDRHCIDPNRVARLPFTPHEKSQRWCIPINPEWDLKKILKESYVMEDCWNVDTEPTGDNNTATHLLNHIIHLSTEASLQKRIPIKYPELDAQTLDTQIEILQSLAKFVTDGRHRMLHYMIVPSLVNAGYTLFQTHSFCKEWIEQTGKNYYHYLDYVTRSFERNKHWKPWSFNKFFYEYSELALPLMEILKEVKKDAGKEET